MIILGIADDKNDQTFALLKDGDILRTAQNLDETLDTVTLDSVESVSYFQKPFLKLERFCETHMAHAPGSLRHFQRDMPPAIKDVCLKKQSLIETLHRRAPAISQKNIAAKFLFSDEQLSLCADAFYPSPYEDAVILCLDDASEWASCSIALGRNSSLTVEQEILYPHSLGLFMDAFAHYLGIERSRLDDLARQGEPTYARMLARSVIDLKPDGSFALNQIYFDYAAGGNWTSTLLHDLLGAPPRAEQDTIERRHCNIAASVLALVAQAASLMVHAIARNYRGIYTLCITGSVAQENIVRERILRDHPFDSVDFYGMDRMTSMARGAALAAYYIHHKQPRDVMFLQSVENRAKKI